jgi:sulfoxide reductase heme-binding subunit YedZ
VARPLPWLVPAVVTGGLLPLGEFAVRGAVGALGADPVAFVLNRLGLLALVFLVLGLACTPVRFLFHVTWPARLTRVLGLLGFGYAVAHMAVYALVDQGLDVAVLWKDVSERPFITVGFAAVVLLVPLAWTSTGTAVRRMGFERWKRLHRLAYAAAALGVVHFWMRVKKDVTEPAVYGTVLLVLLALRAVHWDIQRRRAVRAAVR